MTSIGPDMECTFFPEGWPTWLGGSGNEWHGCCVAHDLVVNDWANAFGLGKCVTEQGFPLVALVMVSGLLAFGWLYKLIKKN